MASPEALQHRAQSLALSLQRRTSCTLREAVRSRAIQISREHLADDFLSRRLSKADYNSLISLAAEEVLTWPAAVGGPLQQGASGATDELFRQKVVAFLDAKKLLLEQHVPAACHAAKNGWSSEPCQPRWPASAPGLMARESEAVCTHTPALASARQSAPPPGCPPCFSALSLGHALSNHSAPVAGFHWFRARRRGEVPHPPLSATVGAAVRRRRQERRHVACCCANGQAFCSRSGSKNAARRHLRAPCDSAVAPSRPHPTPTQPQSPPPTAPAPTARGPMGRGPMGCGPMRRQPSAPCQPLSVPPPPCGGEVPRIM